MSAKDAALAVLRKPERVGHEPIAEAMQRLIVGHQDDHVRPFRSSLGRGSLRRSRRAGIHTECKGRHYGSPCDN